MKARAPPPPSVPQPAPRQIFRNALPDGGLSDSKENQALDPVALHITLPNGYQTSVRLDGRRALMDVLVDLCAQYHLNPADHTLVLATAEGQPLPFKPNAALGSLEVSRAVIVERDLEERATRKPRKPAPKVPEKTVRLGVNYHRGQKAVVRVSPFLPLQSLVPAVCQKCDFDPARVLLLRDATSQHELDLTKTLSELDIRELYVLDQMLALQPTMVSAPVLSCSESLYSNAPSASAAEKKGILGLFRFNQRRSKGLSTVSGVCVEARPNTLGQSNSVMNLAQLSPKAEPKKRRAPAPPPPAAPTPTHTPTLSPPSPAPASQTKPASPKLDTQLKKKKAPAPPPTTAPSIPPSVPITPVVHELRVKAPSDDSMSDLSHSIEDSEPNGSICSSSSSDAAAESSSLTEEPTPEPEHKPEPELVLRRVKCVNVEAEPVLQLNPQPVLKSVVKQEPEETEYTVPLKMDEMENNRHSAVAWLQQAEQEAETASICSSESLADQGYAASEGLAESPSVSPEDTASLCPDSSLSPNQPQEDSDVDEGCATWGSHHSSGDVRGANQPRRPQESYGDGDITRQIHLTLADLDADLADDEASVGMVDEIPVSVVDLDVPVTAIDDVFDEATLSIGDTREQEKKPLDFQNTNNNARVPGAGPLKVAQVSSGWRSEQTENVAPGMSRIVPDSKPELNRALYMKGPKPYQSKISPNPASRFGLRTFTIVPPKVAVSQTQSTANSRSTGAIKIDELGNLVKQKQDKPDPFPTDQDCPLLDRAKAFWGSAQKQDPATNGAARVMARDAGISKLATTPNVVGSPKQGNDSTLNLASAVMKKLAVADPAESLFFSEHRKNFVMPSRKTSNQYVASAVAKYAGSSLTKTEDAQEPPEKPFVSNPDLNPKPGPHHNTGPQRSQRNPSHVIERPEIAKQPQYIGKTMKKPDETSSSQMLHPPVPKKPESLSPGSPPQPSPFGPVRKFKPVIPRVVKKESSLHSSLMEAIQSGEGTERLRKVSDSSRINTTKKPPCTETENERSALLCALRAPSNAARLKQTRSEAAAELETFRMAEENRAIVNDMRGLVLSDPPAPPPPPASIPPPPPVMPLAKPALVLPAGRDPEAAREALLDAIRSGSGARQLRKVPVTTKTFKVSRRLGIIQTSSPPLQEQ